MVVSKLLRVTSTMIVSGSSDTKPRIWDAYTGNAISAPLKGHTGHVNSVAFSPSGAFIFSSSEDGTIRIWGVANACQTLKSGEPAKTRILFSTQ